MNEWDWRRRQNGRGSISRHRSKMSKIDLLFRARNERAHFPELPSFGELELPRGIRSFLQVWDTDNSTKKVSLSLRPVEVLSLAYSYMVYGEDEISSQWVRCQDGSHFAPPALSNKRGFTSHLRRKPLSKPETNSNPLRQKPQFFSLLQVFLVQPLGAEHFWAIIIYFKLVSCQQKDNIF